MQASRPSLSQEIRARLHLRRPCWGPLRAAHPELSDSTFWRRVGSERARAKAERSRSRKELRDPFASVERRRDMTRLLSDLDIRAQLASCFHLAFRIRDQSFEGASACNPYWVGQSIGLRTSLVGWFLKTKHLLEQIEEQVEWERRLLKAVRAVAPSLATSINAAKLSLFDEGHLFAFRQYVAAYGDTFLYDTSSGAKPAALRRALKARRTVLKPLIKMAGEMFDESYAARFTFLLCSRIAELPKAAGREIVAACHEDLEAFKRWNEQRDPSND